MKKHIYEALQRVSSRPEPKPNVLVESPKMQISSDVAFCLNTMMETVGKQLDLSPRDVYEQIISGGIASWLESSDATPIRALGISAASPDLAPQESPANPAQIDMFEDEEEDPMAAKAQQAAFEQMNSAMGYTPMTSHTYGGDPNGGKGGGKGGQRSQKKKRPNNGSTNSNNNSSDQRRRTKKTARSQRRRRARAQ